MTTENRISSPPSPAKEPLSLYEILDDLLRRERSAQPGQASPKPAPAESEAGDLRVWDPESEDGR